ncbi:MAG: CBS domain-containing protein [Chloroflexi bacterium]|nr:CBS domain-containing protein [Chloroflexota bacterium]
MISIRQLLERKGSEVWSTSPDSSVYEALQLLAENDVGALLVLQDGELVGVISERDYARKVVLRGITSMKTPVKEIMTEDVITVGPGSTVEEAMALMTDKHIRHLPVLEGESIVGVVSIGDLVKAIIADQEFTIGQLENYISGTRS